MTNQVLVAVRINNGQSEIWLDNQPEKRHLVATNAIVYPIRTFCSPEESEAFHKALDLGPAHIPVSITDKLFSDLKLDIKE